MRACRALRIAKTRRPANRQVSLLLSQRSYASQSALPEPFASDVIEGLSNDDKVIPFQYFYDDIGAELFTRIAHQPEYYVTRTETEILTANASEVASALGEGVGICELGSGNGAKTQVLLDAATTARWYVPTDIAAEQLSETVAKLGARYPELVVRPLLADFTQPMVLPQGLPKAQRRVIFSPGLTLWNLSVEQRERLLTQLLDLAGAGGACLLGVDWAKDAQVLEAAYDDAAGVTAAFNLNVLERINRELDGTIRSDLFKHNARWDAEAGRVEVALIASCDQSATVAGHRFEFTAGERIVTEHSYKFTPASLDATLERSGWRITRRWSDSSDRMSVVLLSPIG